MKRYISSAVMAVLLLSSIAAFGQTVEIRDHGVPVPASERRGVTATLDGEGNRVALVWLMNGGTKHQLVINVENGETKQIPVEPYSGDNPFAVLHSTRDLWYSLYGGHLYEFDPRTLSFSFTCDIPSRCAMSMYEDPQGIIWASLFPTAHLVSFDPQTHELTDHGQVNEESWAQYTRSMAIDDAGWVYVGIGTAGGQVVGFNPATGERRPYVPQDKRTEGSSGRVFRGTDGKVYGAVPNTDWGWHMLSDGAAPPIEGDPPVKAAPMRTDSQGAFFREFPDGSSLGPLNLEMRTLVVREADGTERELSFDYDTDGTEAAVMCAGPDGKIYGSSAHPSRLFVYNPATEDLYFYPGEGIAFKSLRTQSQYVFGGHYSGGIFWLLDTANPITLTPVSSTYGRQITVARGEEGAENNPKNLGRFNPNVNIPRNAFAHPDGKHIMISGQPGYGHVGGGLIIYNLETEEITELKDEELLPGYSTMAIAALPSGDLLCGTSPRGGHGTTTEHTQASLYILDWQTKKVTWQSEPLEQMASMQSMLRCADGLYYCVGADGTLLVFDAEKREVVHHAALGEYGNHTTNQAMILGPDGKIHLALTRTLLRITPETFEIEVLVTPPGGIEAGLGIIDDRIYFSSRGRLQSIGL